MKSNKNILVKSLKSTYMKVTIHYNISILRHKTQNQGIPKYK
jgi:hypothetical protein